MERRCTYLYSHHFNSFIFIFIFLIYPSIYLSLHTSVCFSSSCLRCSSNDYSICALQNYLNQIKFSKTSFQVQKTNGHLQTNKLYIVKRKQHNRKIIITRYSMTSTHYNMICILITYIVRMRKTLIMYACLSLKSCTHLCKSLDRNL